MLCPLWMHNIGHISYHFLLKCVPKGNEHKPLPAYCPLLPPSPNSLCLPLTGTLVSLVHQTSQQWAAVITERRTRVRMRLELVGIDKLQQKALKSTRAYMWLGYSRKLHISVRFSLALVQIKTWPLTIYKNESMEEFSTMMWCLERKHAIP